MDRLYCDHQGKKRVKPFLKPAMAGLRVRVIRPGDPLHPGGDQTYYVDLAQAEKAARAFGVAMGRATFTLKADTNDMILALRALLDEAP